MKIEHKLSADLSDEPKASLLEMENLLKNARALGFADNDELWVCFKGDVSDGDWVTLEVRKK